MAVIELLAGRVIMEGECTLLLELQDNINGPGHGYWIIRFYGYVTQFRKLAKVI